MTMCDRHPPIDINTDRVVTRSQGITTALARAAAIARKRKERQETWRAEQ